MRRCDERSFLFDLLRTNRPAGGDGVAAMQAELVVNWFFEKQPNGLLTRKVGSNPSTGFFAHLDTVHREDGCQALACNDSIVSVKGGGILGADDAAGIYVILRMIRAGVPGLYVISQDEERGGFSMREAAQSGWFDQFKLQRAVSFDRRGTTDIVTEQVYGHLASHEFAETLSSALGMGHKEASGRYTDSSELAGRVPEIVNISCGYANEHTEDETLDTSYLEALADSACLVDWESLPTVGVPDEPLPYAWLGTWPDETVEFSVDEAIDDLGSLFGYRKLDAETRSDVLDILEALLDRYSRIRSNP